MTDSEANAVELAHGPPARDARLLAQSTNYAIFALALPVLVDQFLAMLVGWSDAYLVGKFLIGKPFLAAIVVGNYLLWFMECCGALVSAGSHAIVARMVGAKDFSGADRMTHQSICLAAALGVVQMFATIGLAPFAVSMLNLQGHARWLAIEFLEIMAVSAPFMQILLVGVVCLQAAGNTAIAMGLMIAANVINISLSWVLCVGAFSAPKLGWHGVAMGTAIGFLVGGIATLACLYLRLGVIGIPRGRKAIVMEDMRRLLRIGLPGGANTLGVVLCQLWFLSIVGGLGDASIGAHGVATRCESLSYLAAEAFAVAAATLVGQSLGARRPDLAKRAGWTAFRMGAYSMSVMGVFFFLFAPNLIALFVDASQAEVTQLGVPILRLVSLAMPALAACIILTGALRGAGDTRWPLAYSLFGLLAVRIPLAYLLTRTIELGVMGAWIAMFADLHVRGICAIWRYRTGKWTLTKV